jgi:hypothetical protein
MEPEASKSKRRRSPKSMQRLTATPRSEFIELEQLPNVGPAFAADLRLIGIRRPSELVGQDAFTLHAHLCRLTQVQHDPCVIDQFLSAIHFMEGGEAKPWWAFTAERKKALEARPDPTKN